MPDAEKQLDAFVDKFEPKHQRLIRAVRSSLRKRLAGATELVYENYNFFVIGYSPTERGIDAIVAIAARVDGVRLYLQGVHLPDPKGLLLGSGRQTRFVRVEAASQLAHPDVKALIAVAIIRASVPLPSKGTSSLVIKSAAAKQRPRRRPTK